VLSELLAAAFLGFALAASPGPVNALAVARGLRDGASRAVFLVLGADTADILYATLVILGAAPFVNRPAVQVVLSIGGGLFLGYLAVSNVRSAWRPAPATTVEAGHSGSRLAAYREGFLIALLSPLTIVFWMSVFGGYYAAATARGLRIPPVVLLAALMLGAAVWSTFAALMIHFGRRSLRARWYAVLVTALSILLLAWALRLLWTGLSMLGRGTAEAGPAHETAPASTMGPVGAALPVAGSSVTANVLGRAVSSTRGSETTTLPSGPGWNRPAGTGRFEGPITQTSYAWPAGALSRPDANSMASRVEAFHITRPRAPGAGSNPANTVSRDSGWATRSRTERASTSASCSCETSRCARSTSRCSARVRSRNRSSGVRVDRTPRASPTTAAAARAAGHQRGAPPRTRGAGVAASTPARTRSRNLGGGGTASRDAPMRPATSS
jgi:threonine/homoserine/homoserine lactone efflux protein